MNVVEGLINVVLIIILSKGELCVQKQHLNYRYWNELVFYFAKSSDILGTFFVNDQVRSCATTLQ